MAFDTALRDRIHALLSDVPDVTGKPMFGGYGVFRNGTMFAGVYRSSLMAKLGAATEDALLEPHTAGFDPMGTGKPMTGWITVAPPAIESDEQLRAWLDRALAVVPKKKSAKRTNKA